MMMRVYNAHYESLVHNILQLMLSFSLIKWFTLQLCMQIDKESTLIFIIVTDS